MRAVTGMVILLAVLGAAPTWAGDEGSEQFPSRALHIVVGFTAGGGNDILARLIGQQLSVNLGQPVVVDNKPGASAILATEYVKNAAPDGYTLLMGATGPISVNPAVYPNLPYSSVHDFAPVSMIASFPLILVVNPALPIQSVKELVAYAKSNPDKANYSSSSPAFQLATELFKLKTGAPMEHIGYRGSGDSVMAVISGTVLMTIADASVVTEQIQTGEVRALAVTATQRLPELPDVPTMTEVGIPDMGFGLWNGLFAPAKTPSAIVQRLQDEIIRVVKLPEISARMRALGVDPVGNTSEEFRRVIASEIDRWTAVARARSIKLDD